MTVSIQHVPNSSFHTSTVRAAKKKDLYDVLGVPKKATAKEIKKAYYQVSSKNDIPLLCMHQKIILGCNC